VSADAASVPRRTENLVSKLIQICASENDLFGLDVDEGVDHSVDVTEVQSASRHGDRAEGDTGSPSSGPSRGD